MPFIEIANTGGRASLGKRCWSQKPVNETNRKQKSYRKARGCDTTKARRRGVSCPYATCLCSGEQHDFIEFIGPRIFCMSKQVPVMKSLSPAPDSSFYTLLCDPWAELCRPHWLCQLLPMRLYQQAASTGGRLQGCRRNKPHSVPPEGRHSEHHFILFLHPP